MNKKILRNLPEHSREGENLNLFADSFIREFDTLNGYDEELIKQIFISTAEGKYLNDIGKIFKLSRQENETDSQFRARILSFWAVFTGNGTIEDIKNSIATLVGIPIENITIDEIDTLVIQAIIGITPETELEILNLIDPTILEAKAAGVVNQNTRFVSKNGIFLANLSEVNGEDLLL